MSSTLSFAPVLAEDYADAREFVVNYFFAYEPMTRAYINGKEPTQEDVDFCVQYLKAGLGIKAVEDGKFVGLSLGYIGGEDDVKAMLEEADRAVEQKWADILRFLAFIQNKSNLRERYGIVIPYEIQMVAVHPDYRGRHIGTELVRRQIKLAKERNLKAVYVDCSSIFTARIMEKLGFECIHQIAFADYRTEEGLQIFLPEDDVHTFMRSFLNRI